MGPDEIRREQTVCPINKRNLKVGVTSEKSNKIRDLKVGITSEKSNKIRELKVGVKSEKSKYKHRDSVCN